MNAAGFPFGAIVGMDDARLALILNAVSPGVGGVLLRGEKGTAKSTMVRALTAVLPAVSVVAGCRFSCDPAAPDPECVDGPHDAVAARHRPARLVELPVGVSEDRVVGALDVEKALSEGVKSYEPGLLAAAHRGVLYVDEVNLLHDHVVDLLLDAAALGRCHVEREGVSVRHDARFVLVGTMNPEEGELRPQLLDRFGLTVEVAAPREVDTRAEVVRRRLAHEAAPEAFAARFAAEQAELAERIDVARRRLPEVLLPDAALRQIAAVCASFEVDGLRADLVTSRAALAHAAWRGNAEVTADDIRVAARLALPHRMRRNPFDPPELDDDKLDEALDRAAGNNGGQRPDDPGASSNGGPDGDGDGPDGDPPPGDGGPDGGRPDGDGRVPDGPPPDGPPPDGQDGQRDDDGRAPDGQAEERQDAGQPSGNGTPRGTSTAPAGATFPTRRFTVPGLGHGAAGRRSRALTDRGHMVGARRPRGLRARPHVAATLAAAAPHQRARGRTAPGGLILHRADLRVARHEDRESNLVLFVVDASGSMAARQRMRAVKGAVVSLLLDAYQRRDKVGLVTFRGRDAEVALPPTSSVDVAAARMTELATGGRTPLATGLLRARELLRVERMRDPARRPLLVVVTDGRATGEPRAVERAHAAAAGLAADGAAAMVVDCESGPVRLGLATALAHTMRGTPVRLSELAAGSLATTVRAAKEAANA